ncbi:hypothetical protein BN439_0837 [Erwinia amylovora Ea644]|uniref:Uncharacterized protein n=3 Tax=Erwinia amylovora TaxID=552 RepID=A0A830ZZT1_ERWAM|nr:hypothetical protein EaACW_0582 [Erwinia amylovora ACW56400]QJQ55700.1 hypothetical protein EHX00_3001 [Erwinia amylovora]CBA19527.1 hypothetical protein predicted by Glimmer/Critica [Erwinia amylovora CFBP1430]CBX79427.1 hypothetical protein predicted by Glimmer/Critica [Erwinia amylovora ATCC BAA-2158]CCO77429.1 hypothetical protein BN432_0598 [Erwinia amylovora Ea356]CCO81213.1 hypothetical protein BN433_0608 [Erwinia amylovora Ea266]CCO85019.1 hypothetical protein BN434_0598 [Erwinia a
MAGSLLLTSIVKRHHTMPFRLLSHRDALLINRLTMR